MKNKVERQFESAMQIDQISVPSVFGAKRLVFIRLSEPPADLPIG